jgi:hypothetical protein
MQPESRGKPCLWDMLQAAVEPRAFGRGFIFANIEHK